MTYEKTRRSVGGLGKTHDKESFHNLVGSRSSAVNARRFLERNILFEVDGEWRVHTLNPTADRREALDAFADATNLRYDASLGVWRKAADGDALRHVETSQIEEAREVA